MLGAVERSENDEVMADRAARLQFGYRAEPIYACVLLLSQPSCCPPSFPSLVFLSESRLFRAAVYFLFLLVVFLFVYRLMFSSRFSFFFSVCLVLLYLVCLILSFRTEIGVTYSSSVDGETKSVPGKR